MNVRIGDLLVQRGVTTTDVVESAVRTATRRGIPLLSQLLHEGLDEGALAAALAERFRVPAVDLSRTCISLDAVGIVPRPVAEADLMLPLSLEGGRVHLAMSRPLDERVISEVRFVTGLEVSPYGAVKAALEGAVADAYDRRARGEKVWRGPAGPGVPQLAVHLPGAAGDLEAVEIELDDDVLPAAPELPPEVVLEVEPEPEPRTPPLRAAARPLLLVVDDEPEIRHLLVKTFSGRGWRVETADDGEEAVVRAEALQPDVVLLDAMLPKVHGFEACLRLKSSPRTRDVPVVIMTAVYRGWRFAEDARDQFGAVDYVEKPFRLDDLQRRVEEARRSASARPVRADGPGPSEPLVKRGRQLLAAGDLPGAVAAFGEAVRVEPYAAEAHHQLGRALRAQGDAFGAMTSLERAAELRPDHLAALRALAALYEEKGFRRNAAGALERALAVAGDDDTRTALRGDLLRVIS